MVYIDNEDGSQAAVAIAPKGATSSSDLKTWMGKVTTDGSKQVTVTDDKTGEAINVTLTKVAKRSLALQPIAPSSPCHLNAPR